MKIGQDMKKVHAKSYELCRIATRERQDLHENKYFLLLLFLFIGGVNFSCSHSSSHKRGAGTDTTFCDSYNRKITFSDNPQRIISAAPGITEILFALGEGHRLVARTDYCDFPAQVEYIASIGGLEDPSIETIASINPDLVIASTHFQKESVQKLDLLKIPVIVIQSQGSFEGAYETIGKIAEILHVQERGDSIISKMKDDVAMVLEKAKLVKTTPHVYYVIGFGKTGDFTAGGNTFISKMIEMAGGKNIAADVNGWSYSLEKLIEEDPEVIFIRSGNKEIFVKTPSYRDLKAVKANKVYEINDDLFEITGPRLVEGLKLLYSKLHE
jgi:iron complex transport system substrate-binding protein